jgi:hypothetical protein
VGAGDDDEEMGSAGAGDGGAGRDGDRKEVIGDGEASDDPNTNSSTSADDEGSHRLLPASETLSPGFVASCAFFSSLWGCIRASYPVAELERAPATWMDADSAVSGDIEKRGDGGVVED